MADATKIYTGPITAIGIAAAATADGGSFTDLGYLSDEAAIMEWIASVVPMSRGGGVQKNGLGKITFTLIETDPAGIQATLETYLTTLGKLKITTVDATNGFHFIDNIFLNVNQTRDMTPEGQHKFIVTAELITENPDDFCTGPKAAS